MAQVALLERAVYAAEKPSRREVEGWDLAEPAERHETGVVLERNGAVVRWGESLWEWRGRVADVWEEEDLLKNFAEEKDRRDSGIGEAGGPENDVSGGARKAREEERKDATKSKEDSSCYGVENSDADENDNKKKFMAKWRKLKTMNKRCIVIAFRGIRRPEPDERSDVEDGEVRLGHLTTKITPPLPLSEMLTIIVTTSPIRSHPSTEMLERTFGTFHFAGDEFAYECRKVIVCDGCRVLDDDNDDSSSRSTENGVAEIPKITRKHANVKQALRNGIATVEQAKNYHRFKSKLRELCQEANEASSDEIRNPFRKTEVVELEERHGYGFALRHALHNCVSTPYVCVIQHDRTFMRPTPIVEVIRAMNNDPQRRIKYVGMSRRSNLMYYDIFGGKYGKKAIEELRTMILRPEELCIGGNVYGPGGTSAKSIAVPKEKVRHNLTALTETYRGSMQHQVHVDWMQSEGADKCRGHDGCHQLSLTPTLFWYDNTHVVETAHYRDFVFHPKYKMVARGGFVEDKLTPAMIRSIERLGLREGHAKYGCYLLDDHSGLFFTGHLDGGSYLTEGDKGKAQTWYNNAENETNQQPETNR